MTRFLPHIFSIPSTEPDNIGNRCKKTDLYGGQAIIEGVMMKGPERTVVACRAPDGKIVHKILREGQDERKRNFWYKTPFLRGFLILIDSMSVGYKALMFSGEIADPDAGPRNPWIENTLMVVSVLIALVIFKFVPIILTNLILGYGLSFGIQKENVTVGASMGFSAIEGIIKATVLVAYILSIRLIEDVRRVFQYHGAEHKTINAYEAGSDLGTDNVDSFPTFHPRCGTSFLFAVILFSLILAMTFPLLMQWIFQNPALALFPPIRFGLHVFFLPIIAALGYEFIRFTAGFDPNSAFMCVLTWPGKMFQKITALEPDRDMLEVAQVSMHLAMGIELPETNKIETGTIDSNESETNGETSLLD